MKNDLFHRRLRVWNKAIFAVVTAITIILSGSTGFAQDSKETASKLSFTMNVNSIVSNGIRSIKVLATRKDENKKTIKVNDLKSPVNLYFNQVKEYDAASHVGWMSKAYLNEEGEATLDFPAWFYKLTDTVHEYNFIVTMNSDPKYEDAQEQLTIADARIDLQYFGKDSVKTATASLMGWKQQAFVPVPQTELKLCVKRTFSFLSFGETNGSTNENGEISGELPLDLPGNANKTLTIAARLEDDPTYGTVEVTKDIPWSVVPKVNQVRGRTLWSPGDNAPLVLVISSVTIIVIIWGTILYLIGLLLKIKRLGRRTS